MPNPAGFDAVSVDPRRPDEPLTTYSVGDVTVVPLVQLHYRVDPARFFPDLDQWPLDRDAWYWKAPYVCDGRLTVDMGGFLVRSKGRVIVIDTGIGNDKNRPNPHFDHRSDDWLSLFSRLGLTPDDVNTVIFTHLHLDHVGFATTWDGTTWRPTFPNADYLVSATELAFWTGDEGAPEFARLGRYLDDSVIPLDRTGQLISTDGVVEVTDEIRLVPAPGHTPGNVYVEVRSAGKRALFVGDMVHHALQLAFPGWSTDFCIDYSHAAEARHRVLASLGDDDLLFTAHFPDSAPGRVRPDGSGAYLFDRVDGTPVI